jgi:hypothetical protein
MENRGHDNGAFLTKYDREDQLKVKGKKVPAR